MLLYKLLGTPGTMKETLLPLTDAQQGPPMGPLGPGSWSLAIVVSGPPLLLKTAGPDVTVSALKTTVPWLMTG